ncbi:SDR family NAD(P)-dependent oxidoreductase [Streptomyces sp. A1547]|nr:SDR family NAD(P)-dependent oxidoreductase [Streptomyces sp. A1547]
MRARRERKKARRSFSVMGRTLADGVGVRGYAVPPRTPCRGYGSRLSATGFAPLGVRRRDARPDDRHQHPRRVPVDEARTPAHGHAGSGVIVNMASGAGLVGVTGFSGYTATKAAVISMTKSTALEAAQHGIRVNAVAPGLVETPMIA